VLVALVPAVFVAVEPPACESLDETNTREDEVPFVELELELELVLEAGVVVDVRVMVVVTGPESLEEFVIVNVGLMLPESPSKAMM